ncbi:MAG: extracellular solute-binding protein [Firmicutes bacterium]|nr:extracellular solute-binding protein [Bacillota bacterium]
MLVILSLLILAMANMTLNAAKPVTINALFMKQAGYSEDEITQGTKEFEAKYPNIKVNLTFVPYEALEQKIITSAQSGEFDVVLSDAPFTAKFAEAGIVRPLPKLPAADLKDIFLGAIEAGMYKGKFYGMPWLNDCKYLFYNKRMLKEAGFSAPPKTWDELLAQAKVIKAKGLVKYPIAWSWAQAEALICDFTTLTCAFGGGMYDKKNRPQFTHAANRKALDFMIETLKNGISNPHSIEWLEDNVRAVFSAGDAAFCLNWTYLYNAAKDPTQSKIVDDVGIAVIPGSAGVVSATVNGGMPLSISAGSKHPNEAWTYIKYMASKEFQGKYCANALPIWKSLFDDPKVVAANPEVVAVAKIQYDYFVNRPIVPYYSDLSTFLQAEIQQALLGKKSSIEVLKAAQAKAMELAKK